jgi:hypothetical protein
MRRIPDMVRAPAVRAQRSRSAHRTGRGLRAAALAAMISATLATAARGQSAYVSATGTFTSALNPSQRFIVDFPVGDDTTFRTWAWSGGVNAAGNVVPANGIDSVLWFSDGVEFDAVNDDISVSNRDSLLTVPDVPASGTLTLSHNPSANGMHWAVDMTRNGALQVRRSVGTNSSVGRFTWGGTSPGIARLRLGLPASLVTTGPVIGRAGSSLEIVNGGRLTAGTDFVLEGIGTMSAGTLAVNGIQYMNGSMLQTGGVNTSHKVTVGHEIGERGTMRISGGTLSTSWSDVSYFGTGTFIQDGGHVTIANNLRMGVGAHGQYELNGGTFTLGALENGFASSAAFIQTGGAAQVTTALLARQAHTTGRYSLSGGSLTTGQTVVGEHGAGTFTLLNADHQAGSIQLGLHPGARGSYLIGSGTLRTTGDLNVGDGGDGAMSQSGGVVIAQSVVHVGARPGSAGNYSMHAGVLNAGLLKVGSAGAGTFDHGGGIVHPAETWIAEMPGSVGRFHLRNDAQAEMNKLYVGVGGEGRVIQTGGNLGVTNFDTFIGYDPGSIGAYDQSGGTHATRDVVLAQRAGSHGAYTLSGGTLSPSSSIIVGKAGYGTFTQTGGVATPQFVYVGTFDTNPGEYNLHGGTLAVSGRLQVNPTGTVNFTGGRLQVGTLDVRGEAHVNVIAGGDKVLRAGAIETYGSGRLDLADNAAVVDYAGASPLNAIRNYVRIGHNGGNWNGVSIRSSAAAAEPGHGLGYAEASAIFTSFPATFAGEVVDNSTVVIRYARYGDADLSGTVNLADFNRLATSFGGANKLWTDGDFNYDGLVNLIDFNKLAANFGLSAAGPEITPEDWARLGTSVPEPSLSSMLVLSSIPLLRRRRARA